MTEIEQTKQTETPKKGFTKSQLEKMKKTRLEGQNKQLPSSIGLCKGCFSQAGTITVKPHIGKVYNIHEISLSKNRDPQAIIDYLNDSTISEDDKKQICGVFIPCRACTTQNRWFSMGRFGFNSFLSHYTNSRSLSEGKGFPYYVITKDKETSKKRSYNILSPVLPKVGHEEQMTDEEFFDYLYESYQEIRESFYDFPEEEVDNRI